MRVNKHVQSDDWRPVRTHVTLRRFRRGPGKTIRFVGQQEDEKLRRIVREHPIFYVRSVVPFLLTLVFTGLVAWLASGNALAASLYPVLDLICSLALIATGLYGIYRIFALWWANVYIVTNKRVLAWRGFLTPTRDETTLDKVQQVSVDQHSLGMLLSYGTVHVYLAGGKALILRNVPNPKSVREDIEGIRQSYHAAKPPGPPLPLPDTAPARRLGKLSAKESLPQLPDADLKYEHLRSATKARGPLRRFGGPLRLTSDVHYDAEEYTVMYVRRSWLVLAFRLIIPVLLLLATLFAALTLKADFNLLTIAFFFFLVPIGLAIINYIDDIFILTNKRIIDINRKFVILAQQSDTTTYDKISKIEVRSPNVFQLALDIGNLFIETQGNNPNISMRSISHALYIQDKIYEIKNFKEKVDKIKAKNDRKDELKEWFSSVQSTMRGVPDLRSLDLLTALERAEAHGMEIEIIDECARQPGEEPGKIVMQSPSAGAVVYVDPENPQEKPHIQVILSG